MGAGPRERRARQPAPGQLRALPRARRPRPRACRADGDCRTLPPSASCVNGMTAFLPGPPVGGPRPRARGAASSRSRRALSELAMRSAMTVAVDHRPRRSARGRSRPARGDRSSPGALGQRTMRDQHPRQRGRGRAPDGRLGLDRRRARARAAARHGHGRLDRRRHRAQPVLFGVYRGHPYDEAGWPSCIARIGTLDDRDVGSGSRRSRHGLQAFGRAWADAAAAWMPAVEHERLQRARTSCPASPPRAVLARDPAGAQAAARPARPARARGGGPWTPTAPTVRAGIAALDGDRAGAPPGTGRRSPPTATSGCAWDEALCGHGGRPRSGTRRRARGAGPSGVARHPHPAGRRDAARPPRRGDRARQRGRRDGAVAVRAPVPRRRVGGRVACPSARAEPSELRDLREHVPAAGARSCAGPRRRGRRRSRAGRRRRRARRTGR